MRRLLCPSSQTLPVTLTLTLDTDPHRAIITEGCTAPYCTDSQDGNGHRHVLVENAAAYIVENVKVSLKLKTLHVNTGKWVMSAASTVGAPHFRRLRLNMEIRPTYLVDHDPVAPHGLLGQTYDRDGLEVNGRLDNYDRLDDGTAAELRKGEGGHVTTRCVPHTRTHAHLHLSWLPLHAFVTCLDGYRDMPRLKRRSLFAAPMRRAPSRARSRTT